MKKYIYAILIWILIIPIAILNGGLREHVLNKLGDIALPLSGIILSVCIFIVAFLFIPKIKNCIKKQLNFKNAGVKIPFDPGIFNIQLILIDVSCKTFRI